MRRKPKAHEAVVFALLATAISFTVSVYADSSRVCQHALESTSIDEKSRIVEAYNRFQVIPLPLYRGISLSRADVEPGKRTSWRSLSVPDSFVKGWHVDTWYFQEKVYQFIDVGFRNFEGEANKVNHIMAEHMVNHPKKNLKITFGPKRQEAERILRRYRWLLHGQVLDRYSQIKKYLSDEDLFALQWNNVESTNIDVFGLVERDERLPKGLLTNSEFKERLRMTLQISYYGEHSLFQPKLEGILRARGHAVPSTKDRLPFETRLAGSAGELFQKDFYQRFDRHSTCEFTRLAKFVNDLPKPIFDRFIFEAMRTAERRGMRTIVASADAVTARLFKQYGFKVYRQLPTLSGADEYLTYMEIDSPEHNLAVIDLLGTALRVIVRPDGQR